MDGRIDSGMPCISKRVIIRIRQARILDKVLEVAVGPAVPSLQVTNLTSTKIGSLFLDLPRRRPQIRLRQDRCPVREDLRTAINKE